jgi:hypothetical protein
LKLSYFIVLFGTGVIIISFFVALAFMKKKKPQYYNYIFVYIILGLLLSINTIINNNDVWLSSKKKSISIEQSIFICQTLMLGLFFIEVLKNSIHIIKIKILLFLIILIQTSLLIIILATNTEIRPSILSNIILILFCFFYLRDLMNNKPTLILVKSSVFWIVIGIFFSSSISFPINSLIPFIVKEQEYRNFRSYIFSISNMSVIVMYLLFIKSYLCLKHPQNL